MRRAGQRNVWHVRNHLQHDLFTRPDGKYVFIADGTNDKVWIQDRKTGALAGSIGDNGRMAGYFHWIDAIAIDSKGNLYTGERGYRQAGPKIHPHEC